MTLFSEDHLHPSGRVIPIDTRNDTPYTSNIENDLVLQLIKQRHAYETSDMSTIRGSIRQEKQASCESILDPKILSEHKHERELLQIKNKYVKQEVMRPNDIVSREMRPVIQLQHDQQYHRMNHPQLQYPPRQVLPPAAPQFNMNRLSMWNDPLPPPSLIYRGGECREPPPNRNRTLAEYQRQGDIYPNNWPKIPCTCGNCQECRAYDESNAVPSRLYPQGDTNYQSMHQRQPPHPFGMMYDRVNYDMNRITTYADQHPRNQLKGYNGRSDSFNSNDRYLPSHDLSSISTLVTNINSHGRLLRPDSQYNFNSDKAEYVYYSKAPNGLIADRCIDDRLIDREAPQGNVNEDTQSHQMQGPRSGTQETPGETLISIKSVGDQQRMNKIKKPTPISVEGDWNTTDISDEAFIEPYSRIKAIKKGKAMLNDDDSKQTYRENRNIQKMTLHTVNNFVKSNFENDKEFKSGIDESTDTKKSQTYHDDSVPQKHLKLAHQAETLQGNSLKDAEATNSHCDESKLVKVLIDNTSVPSVPGEDSVQGLKQTQEIYSDTKSILSNEHNQKSLYAKVDLEQIAAKISLTELLATESIESQDGSRVHKSYGSLHFSDLMSKLLRLQKFDSISPRAVKSNSTKVSGIDKEELKKSSVKNTITNRDLKGIASQMSFTSICMVDSDEREKVGVDGRTIKKNITGSDLILPLPCNYEVDMAPFKSYENKNVVGGCHADPRPKNVINGQHHIATGNEILSYSDVFLQLPCNYDVDIGRSAARTTTESLESSQRINVDLPASSLQSIASTGKPQKVVKKVESGNDHWTYNDVVLPTSAEATTDSSGRIIVDTSGSSLQSSVSTGKPEKVVKRDQISYTDYILHLPCSYEVDIGLCAVDNDNVVPDRSGKLLQRITSLQAAKRDHVASIKEALSNSMHDSKVIRKHATDNGNLVIPQEINTSEPTININLSTTHSNIFSSRDNTVEHDPSEEIELILADRPLPMNDQDLTSLIVYNESDGRRNRERQVSDKTIRLAMSSDLSVKNGLGCLSEGSSLDQRGKSHEVKRTRSEPILKVGVSSERQRFMDPITVVRTDSFVTRDPAMKDYHLREEIEMISSAERYATSDSSSRKLKSSSSFYDTRQRHLLSGKGKVVHNIIQETRHEVSSCGIDEVGAQSSERSMNCKMNSLSVHTVEEIIDKDDQTKKDINLNHDIYNGHVEGNSVTNTRDEHPMDHMLSEHLCFGSEYRPISNVQAGSFGVSITGRNAGGEYETEISRYSIPQTQDKSRKKYTLIRLFPRAKRSVSPMKNPRNDLESSLIIESRNENIDLVDTIHDEIRDEVNSSPTANGLEQVIMTKVAQEEAFSGRFWRSKSEGKVNMNHMRNGLNWSQKPVKSMKMAMSSIDRENGTLHGLSKVEGFPRLFQRTKDDLELKNTATRHTVQERRSVSTLRSREPSCDHSYGFFKNDAIKSSRAETTYAFKNTSTSQPTVAFGTESVKKKNSDSLFKLEPSSMQSSSVENQTVLGEILTVGTSEDHDKPMRIRVLPNQLMHEPNPRENDVIILKDKNTHNYDGESFPKISDRPLDSSPNAPTSYMISEHLRRKSTTSQGKHRERFTQNAVPLSHSPIYDERTISKGIVHIEKAAERTICSRSSLGYGVSTIQRSSGKVSNVTLKRIQSRASMIKHEGEKHISPADVNTPMLDVINTQDLHSFTSSRSSHPSKDRLSLKGDEDKISLQSAEANQSLRRISSVLKRPVTLSFDSNYSVPRFEF